MKTYPIIFSTPMVQAIIEGRKTMTRRIVNTTMHGWDAQKMQFTIVENHKSETIGCQAYFKDKENHFHLGIKCPYGQPGDVLWVRETWTETQVRDEEGWFYVFKADGDDWAAPWKPSIHMPKAACRIFLEITSVRVERLLSISHKDAICEGVLFEKICQFYFNYLTSKYLSKTAISSFASLWVSINGRDSWNSNPFVWVIEFKKVSKPENF